jgi:hypothetical protein
MAIYSLFCDLRVSSRFLPSQITIKVANVIKADHSPHENRDGWVSSLYISWFLSIMTKRNDRKQQLHPHMLSAATFSIGNNLVL